MFIKWTKEFVSDQKKLCQKGSFEDYITAAKNNYGGAVFEIERLYSYLERDLLESNPWQKDRLNHIKANLRGPLCNKNEEDLLAAIAEIERCHAQIFYLQEKLDTKIKSEDMQIELPFEGSKNV